MFSSANTLFEKNKPEVSEIDESLTLAEEAIAHARLATNKSFHLLLGNTGSARSLIINLLAGVAMEKTRDLSQRIVLQPQIPITKVAYSLPSATKYPTLHECAKDVICCDSISFNSFFQSPTQEDKISMALSLALMTQFANEVSGITIVINEILIDKNFAMCAKLFFDIGKLFKIRNENLKNAIQFLIVSHQDVSKLNEVRENFFEMRDEILNYEFEQEYFYYQDLKNLKSVKFFARAINEKNVMVVNPFYFNRDLMLEKIKTLPAIPTSAFKLDTFYGAYVSEPIKIDKLQNVGLSALYESMLTCFAKQAGDKQTFQKTYADLVANKLLAQTTQRCISLPQP